MKGASRFRTLALAGLCFSLAPALQAAAPKLPHVDTVARNENDAPLLSNAIDRFIAEQAADKGVSLNPLADDAEFFRRVHLDLVGKIATAWEVRAFLEDDRADKRRRLVDRLLKSPQHAAHQANVWRRIFLPDADKQEVRFFKAGFESWLRQRFQDNTAHDRLARELLTYPVAEQSGRNFQAASPLAFYQAADLKPEGLAGATTRSLLGIKLECAQCHNHPFAAWKRQQFWEMSAFFAGLQGQKGNGVFGNVREVSDLRRLRIAGTDTVVSARLLDGSVPKWEGQVKSRTALADWITSPENKFFARSTVNRVWAQFFGLGLVEPLDEIDDRNLASHPALLDELTRQFIAHDFDMQFLIRAIVNSHTYQLSGEKVSNPDGEGQLFVRMAVKGLSPEQLFDSLAVATGYREQGDRDERRARNDFLSRFTTLEKPTEVSTSILQALMLMNGKFVADATDVDRSRLLAAALDAPFLKDDTRCVETLYLATLGRKPRQEEQDRLLKYIKSGGPRKDRKAALADVYWALLNSPEFIFNH